MVAVVRDKLYEGHWSAVPAVWRVVHTHAASLQAATCMSLGDGDAAARACDSALLLGAPVLDGVAARLASELCAGAEGPGKRRRADVPAVFVAEPVAADGPWRAQHSAINADIARCIQGASTSPVPAIPPPDLVSFGEYMRRGEPVVLVGGAAHWPALRRWNDPAYLLRRAGRRTVPVELGAAYTDADWQQQLTTLEHFIHDHVLHPGPKVRAWRRGVCVR